MDNWLCGNHKRYALNLGSFYEYYLHLKENILKTKSNFTVLLGNKLLPIILPYRWVYLSDNLVTYYRQRSKRIINRQIQMKSEIKLLQRTNLNYCLNSKGDNFNVKQL